MKATEVLQEEHQGVLLALRVLEKIGAELAQAPTGANRDPAGDLTRLLDFLRVFVDKCHHGKEEDVLFPALLEAGLPREGGPVQVMLAEHEAGRKLVAAMSRSLADHQAGQTGAAAALRAAAGEYAKLLTDHISKEDYVLYPIADEKIAVPVQAAMVEAFEKIEEERIGVGTHERYHEMLKEFRRGYLSKK